MNSPKVGFTSSRPRMSSRVSTVTPRKDAARVASTRTTRACAYGERRTRVMEHSRELDVERVVHGTRDAGNRVDHGQRWPIGPSGAIDPT